jgi:hypothetical protein
VGKLPVFAVGLLAVLYQLTRAPRDRGLRLIALCLAAALASGVFELDWAARALVAHTGLATAKLLQNLLLCALFFLLISFFLHAAGQRRQIRAHATIVITAGIALTAVMWCTPASQRGAPYLTAAHSRWLATFYLIGLTYLTFATVVAARAAWRYSCLTEPRIRRGLRFIVLALALALVIPVERLVTLSMWAADTAMPPAIDHAASGLQSLSIPVFVTGFVLPAASSRLQAARRWWRHRREHHQLAPLWNTLHDAFPEDALHRDTATSWLDTVTLRSVHRQCHRRAIECRDGLVRLSPYWPLTNPHHRLQAHGESRIDTPIPATPDEQAQCLRASLQAMRDGKPPHHAARLIVAPPAADRDSDIAALVALSQAWYRLTTTPPAAT